LVRLQEKALPFNLQELDVLEWPLARRIGVTFKMVPFHPSSIATPGNI